MINNPDLEKIYNKIIEVYPFLNKTERLNFEKKGTKIIKRPILNKGNIKSLLDALKNPHAYLWVWKKVSESSIKEKRKVSYFIKNRILEIKIPSWSGKLGVLDKNLISICAKNSKKYDSIILDVRENQGGNSRIAHNFAGIFFKKPVSYGKFVKRKTSGGLFSFAGVLEPNGHIYINKPIVILVSKKCFSSNELFLTPFKLSGRATLIGQTTRGGSANPISETLDIAGEKVNILIPTWRFYLRGQNYPIEKTKIKPDIFYNKKDISKFSEDYIKRQILP